LDFLSDNSLMLKVKEGDLDKLGLLYERYKKLLFAFFYRMNQDKDLSEDLVQNVFIRIMKYRYTFRGDGAFKIWLLHIARNMNHEHFRKNKNRTGDSLEGKYENLSGHQEEESARDRDDNLELLKMAIGRLGEEKREIIMLSKIDGIKYKEIGEILDCSEGAVKTKVFRALRELRTEFEKVKNAYG
jgi:RNA polymerase sigma factor (sigma-70 family)